MKPLTIFGEEVARPHQPIVHPTAPPNSEFMHYIIL